MKHTKDTIIEFIGLLIVLTLCIIGVVLIINSTARAEVPSDYSEYLPPLKCPDLPYFPLDSYVQEESDHLGRIYFQFDANNDGMIDTVFGHDIGDGRRLPRFYEYDLNFDGTPDIKYEDFAMDGTCEHMHIVWTKPTDKDARPDVKPPSRHQGTPIQPHGPQCEGEV